MKLSSVHIRNFRRLEDVEIDVEEGETVLVGPNNSGKTSATAVFRCFLGGRSFRIHDFSVSRAKGFETFSVSGDGASLPRIELDLWFTIDPDTIEFGQVFSLLPSLSDFNRLGLRLSFGFAEPQKLFTDYDAACPANAEGARPQTIVQYLAMDSNLSRHTAVGYSSIEERQDDDGKKFLHAAPIEPEEGRRLVRRLVRVEFVDAQRNINDEDSNRSNRLSAAFAAFYHANLQQPGQAADAYTVIDQNNQRLTAHYNTQFAPLIELIKGLGVPSVNDRDIRIISSLSPEAALRGSTELLYVDPARRHELPELYNGLGFKNLIYMAIQIRHFHSQWLSTNENRPLCLLIFIEEPEVHLHAQVQQTFIANIWKVVKDSAKRGDEPTAIPQMVVTTHSSHILDAVDFERVRYFRRCNAADESSGGIRNASEVLSLRAFSPEAHGAAGSSDLALAFLKRYLKLTHCDLFFADAAILVEGAVEKLLLPMMIEKSEAALLKSYLTVLEVGGAFAYRFEGLLAFLRIPYLIITDLDSVDPADSGKACRADSAGAKTSNETLTKLLSKTSVADLMTIKLDGKFSAEMDRCVVYQTDVLVVDKGVERLMRPRTIEEALVYDNFTLLRQGKIDLGRSVPDDLLEAYETVYDRVRSTTFKKTDFAMSLLAGPDEWNTPRYIAEGLSWLATRLHPRPDGANVGKSSTGTAAGALAQATGEA